MVAIKNKQPIVQLGEALTKEFFDSLTADEKKLFQAASISTSLLQEVECAEHKHIDVSWSRKASASVLPFIAGVEQYGHALDVFANRIPRCLRLYPENTRLQQAVSSVFKDMFEFATKAKKVFRVGKERSRGILSMKHAVGFATSLRILWHPFDVEFGSIKERIATSVVAIETEADVAEKELANQERRRDHVRWSQAEASQRVLAEFIDDQSMAKVNEWLSPANITTNHKAAANLRHGDSGNWFLQGGIFQKWLHEDNSFLWLNAIPGAGKTVLASSIINYLRDNVQSKTTNFAYFYCDYKDAQKQEPSKVLGTILATLGKQNKEVYAAIEKFFLQQYKDTSAFTADFDELLSNFGTFVNGTLDSAIIVVDALDEAGVKNIDCLTHAFKLLHQQCRSLKILITSRNELPIARAFEGLPRTSIEQNDVASDIKNFITSELSAKISQRRLKLRDPGLELVIRDSLVDGSKGMFQWAKCQIEALCKLRNDKAIRVALLNLPKTLQETYIRILRRIEDEYPDDTDTVRKILCWLVRGIRKPTLDELAEGIAVDPENDDTSMDFDAVDNDPEDILEQLGGLVTVSPDRAISLAHYSVKEFLVSDDLKDVKPAFWIGDTEVEAYLASVCLTYLSYEDFNHPALPDKQAFEERLEEYKLFRYASEAWAIHAQRSEKDGHQPEQVVDLTMRLLNSRDETHANFDAWFECHQHFKYSKQFYRKSGDPLFVAAFFGLTEAAAAIFQETNPDVQMVTASFRAAATNGHAGVVRVFLEYAEAHTEWGDSEEEDSEKEDSEKEDSETEDSEEEEDSEQDSEQEEDSEEEEQEEEEDRVQLGCEKKPGSCTQHGLKVELPRALYSAAAKGHTTVIPLLLAHGVQIDARGGRNGTAIQAAALEGRADTVKLLLEQGASHAEVDTRYGTPLAAAAEKAHERTFDVLLDFGADANRCGGWFALPLVSAIVGKNINIVRRLIEAGSDVNAVGGRHGGPLSAAAAFGMNDLIKELVQHGSKVNDNDDKASDALYSASLAGNVSTVELLLDLGANVNAKGGRHQNALGAASSEGHVEIVEALLDAGADITFFDDRWGNALQVASLRGHVAVVSLLVDAGVDPNAPSTDKGTALICAASNGHESVIKALLDLGVPSGPTEEMTGALVAASLGGHIKTVQLLLDNGADIDGLKPSKTASYCTAIQAAANKGHTELVQRLISLGAEINEVDEGWFGTALLAAVDADSGQTIEMVTTLLNAGVDVNGISPESSEFHGSALVHAVRKGDIECTTLLLERGADINAQQSAFLSPLQMATEENEDGMIDLLIDRGADLNIFAEPLDVRDDIADGLDWATMTALQDAAWYGHSELVRKLVGLGANLSVPHEEAPFASALQAAAYCGNEETVKVLIELGSDVNERGGYFGSALQSAACMGHLGVARILLTAGAIANEIDIGHYNSALLAVCVCMEDFDTSLELVKLLVKHGADMNQKLRHAFPYPLHASCKADGDDDNGLTEWFLENGADPNARGGQFGTALQAAAARGEVHNVELLLKFKADPNITGGFYNTAIQAAYRRGWYLVIRSLYKAGARNDVIGGSRAGSVMGQALGTLKGLNDEDDDPSGCCHTLIRQLMVNHDFDPNMEYGIWGNALQNAVVATRDEEITLILANGADVNKVGGWYGTAITAAAFQGDMEIFEQLLEAGADINLGNKRYPNAAFGAIQGSNVKILETLIEKGVNVKDASGTCGTTMQCAAQANELQMVRILLRAGVEINTPDCGKFGSALQVAAIMNQDEMVRFLVYRGADVRAKGGRYGGPLIAAVLGNDAALVEFLLERGADVNERGKIYASPLQAAACEGELENVLVLLWYGADIDHCGGKYGTALQAACAGGRTVIAKLLVERGARLDTVGGRYRTALAAAAIRSDEEMVRYLLENGATWSLVDRKKLGHVKLTLLDEADELLKEVLRPPTTKVIEAATDVTTTTTTSPPQPNAQEDTHLPWNVESIPHTPYPLSPISPNSGWAIIRELSSHSLQHRQFKNETLSMLSPGKSEFSDIDSGFFSRSNSDMSTMEGSLMGSSRSSTMKSRRVFSKSVSRADTGMAVKDEVGLGLGLGLGLVEEWDSNALGWVQI
ncbi:ankyrin [Pleomassaria siparia CBS 279.74]|uniref:Ankyrin n=1 Tax=Pleomassaria siparia CBS 279.74 TaxID=1314801 RepID=A0A6G1KF99_9PLEO|nr:ankyrin [Pleomassaria siparia CBS 279.74]